MPAVTLDHEPPAIPGLHVHPTHDGRFEVRGPWDAIEAAGYQFQQWGDYIVFGNELEGVTLRDFQKHGVAKVGGILRTHGGAILADEMGLGKTVQASVIAKHFCDTHSMLVVCPAGVRHQWESWFQRVGAPNIANLGPPSTKLYKPEWERWLRPAQQGAVWGVTSYAKMGDALAARKPRLIIFDEPHNYMQSRGNTYVKVMWKHGAQIQYKLALTGSPYLSKPAGLWSLLNVLLGMRFGKAAEFDARYCDLKFGKYGPDRSGVSNAAELAQRLTHYMVRRMKADVASELPKVTRVTRWVEGTKEAKGAFVNAQYTSMGLRTAQEPTLAAKIPEVVEAAQETQAPCVIFCWRREDAEAVGKALLKEKERVSVIHGEYDAAARARMVADAAARKCHVVTTYGASATGLDGLQRFSSHAIFHAIDPVPAILLQAIARLDRMGQTLPITCTFVAMRGSVDEVSTEKVVDRLDVYQKVLGKDVSSGELRDALMAGGVGDIDNDKVLQAVFDSMTGA